MKKSLYSAVFSVFLALPAFAMEVNEIDVTDDPYIGVSIDFSQYGPMVSLSNITDKLNPSPVVQNVDRLITSLAQSKSAKSDLFKKDKKVLEYLNPNKKFTVKRVLKTGVYANDVPDEYTTYILEDSTGRVYAIPDFELKELSRVSLTSYEKGLVEEFNKQNNYARVSIYFKKPSLYKNKQAPYAKKELNSVFDFFLDKIKDYKHDKVLLSERNFRLSMTIPVDTLVYLISEYNNLYIEDIEVISESSKQVEEQDYETSKVRYKESPLKQWYDR